MHPHLYAVFCDDVRFELEGKTSFMGVYDSYVAVPSLPATLRNFVVYGVAIFPIDQLPTSVRFELRLDDEVIASATSEGDPSDVHSRPDDPRKGPFTRWICSNFFPFAPFTLVREGILRLFAITEYCELQSLALEVVISSHTADR